ncbi:MAG: lycopene cyclase [Saprospiraceae bacterium]|nr:MAG: lycopene cyclase [Saprospiraceae bacterium]
MREYDYIITGGGAAGLSLVYYLLHSPLRDKRILIVDKTEKTQNDRTWCFWEPNAGPFESIVYKSWQHLSFYTQDLERHATISPFTYKMIRGIDFYRFVNAAIEKSKNVDRVYGSVETIVNKEGKVSVTINGVSYIGRWCFNSILFAPIDKLNYNYLDQHFKGWVINMKAARFDPEKATLMDFRLPQQGETRFFYVLPIDQHRALVELAIFSNKRWPQEQYDVAIQKYLNLHHNIYKEDFSILEEEFGVIPMTDFPFNQREGRIIHIGTAGGHTKASTGYTFWRMQQALQKMVESMVASGDPYPAKASNFSRFKLYDSVLLYILEKNILPADYLFARLFKKNSFSDILKFLNERTTLTEELKIVKALPILVFSKVMLKEIWLRLKRKSLY